MVPCKQASRRGKSQGETRASIHKINCSVYFDDLLGMCFHESANGLRRLFEFRRRELDSECCAIRRGGVGESLEFRAGFVSRELDSIQVCSGGAAADKWWNAGLERHAHDYVGHATQGSCESERQSLRPGVRRRDPAGRSRCRRPAPPGSRARFRAAMRTRGGSRYGA
jgi:hypothetical protein